MLAVAAPSDKSAGNQGRHQWGIPMSKANTAIAIALAGAVLIAATPALAAQCDHKGGFNGFLADIKKEAAGKGVSMRGLAALDGLTVDDGVLAATGGSTFSIRPSSNSPAA
jgi:hypothetical protein